MEFKRGRLIVIEGADGTGKATQTNMLVKKLVVEGYDAKSLDFPQYGKNIFADIIGASLDNRFGNPTELNPYLISLPYAADRWTAAPIIRAEIARGTILVSNRYTSASMGHQGSKIANVKERFEFYELLKVVEFGEKGFNIPQPDLTVLLYIN